MEQRRKSLGDKDAVRKAEMACYLTHCDWLPQHLKLALRTAYSSTFKLENYEVIFINYLIIEIGYINFKLMV